MVEFDMADEMEKDNVKRERGIIEVSIHDVDYILKEYRRMANVAAIATTCGDVGCDYDPKTTAVVKRLLCAVKGEPKEFDIIMLEPVDAEEFEQ